jgi:hypothetical protein
MEKNIELNENKKEKNDNLRYPVRILIKWNAINRSSAK